MKKLRFENPAFDWDTMAFPSTALLESEQDLLLRCATIHTFDRRLYDEVLSQYLEGSFIGFDSLAAHRSVEALPGPGDRYQVRRSQREEILDSQLPALRTEALESDVQPEIPAAMLIKFSRRIFKWYTQEERWFDLLYHQVLLNLPEAGELLDKLFQEALGEFNLSRCYAILQIVEDHQARVGPELRQLWRLLRPQLEARSMWAQEWYETESYLERDLTQGLFEELIEGDKHWILHVYGPGGLGKTMYLHEVIARRCVPQGIPVALIDFDFVEHRARVAHEPWRILLRIAKQLNRQLPQGPFQDLLREFPDSYFAEMGHRRPAYRPRGFEPLSDEERKVMRDRVLHGFIDTMSETLDDRPFLLIFDTLETLRHRWVNMTAAFELLADVREGCPGLRAIVAGRFNLSDAVALPSGHAADVDEGVLKPGFAGRFGGQQRTVSLEPFSPKEAREYLVSKRGLPVDDKELLKAIIEKSSADEEGCLPFKLKLFADLVREEGLAAEKIREYRRADLAYLIERVVDRILDDRVKWLVRYGVVPRRLTKDFMQRVMLPYLPYAPQNVDRDELPDDDPAADPVPTHDPVREGKRFRVRGWDRAPVDVDELWALLYRYSSEYSWVSQDEELPDALAFQSEVAAPMRYMLREQERKGKRIFQKLNRDAIDYCQKRAKEGPGERGMWLAEAVFHKFMTGDKDAGEYWHQQMDDWGEELGTAIALAEDALELADAGRWQESYPGEDPPTVGLDVLVRANYELARCYLEDGRDPGQVRLRLDAAESLHPAGREVGPDIEYDPGRIVPLAKLGYIRASLHYHDNKLDEALQVCRKALEHPADKKDELDLRLLYANILRSLDSSEAVEQYRNAYMLAVEYDEQRRREIAPRLAADLEGQEQFEEANNLYERLWQDAYDADDLKGMGENLLAMMRVYVAMGQEGSAVEAGQRGLGALYGSGSRAALYWWRRCRAEIELARGMPEEALAELRQLNDWLSGSGLPEGAEDWRRVEADLQARIASERLEIGLAVTKLRDLAEEHYGESSKEGARCYLECTRLYLDEVLDLGKAADYLKLAEKGAQDAATEMERQLLEIRRLALSCDSKAALQAAERLVAEEHALPPGLSTRVAVEALVLAGGSHEAVGRLGERLNEVVPWTRRPVALTGLRHLERKTVAGMDLDPLAEVPFSPDEEGQDPGFAAVRLADVYRIVGDEEKARELVESAEGVCREPLRLGLLRQAYLAHDRIGWELGELEAMDAVPFDHPGWGRNKNLCGLVALEHGERLVAWASLQDADSAQLMLEEADRLLGTSSLWQARLELLRAGIALARGDSQYAQQILVGAKGLIESIGRPRPMLEQVERLEEAISAIDRAPFEAQSVPESFPGPDVQPWVEIHLRAEAPDRWEVSYRQMGGRETVPGRMLSVAVPGEYAEMFESGAEVVGHSFLKVFKHDWQALARRLGEGLFPPEIQSWLPPDLYDVAWRLMDPKLAWVPWEFITIDEGKTPLPLAEWCRYFYRHAGRALPSVEDKPSYLDVLILRIGEEMEVYGQRAMGYDLAWQYEQRGARVRPFMQPEAEELSYRLESDRPRILHIVANIRADYGRRLYLDFGGEAYAKMRPARLKPGELGYAMQRAGVAPLVILDTPAPPSITERLRQLCLRNAFAAELAASTGVSAILGIGLGDDSQQAELTDMLLHGLNEGEPIGEVARRLWRRSRKEWTVNGDSWRGIEPGLPFLGTALFTRDPDQVFVLKEL